jgi:hypothetical protein
MKIIALLSILMFASCARGKEIKYTGSTPAGIVARSFLGISPADSIDFIRWKLSIADKKFTLSCNYGIGKPNTNGFMNGGKTIQLNGVLKQEGNYYYLQNENKTLKLLQLNNNLIHLLDNNKNLLVGNAGFSYTLCNEKPLGSEKININPQEPVLKDSMAFEGRTPCPGLRDSGLCYKLKWSIIFYADTKTNRPTSFHMRGTAYRKEGVVINSWTIIRGKDGRIIYQLNNLNNTNNRNETLYLLKLDENVLVFTDEKGNLLIGNEDFSYTLNRRW